MKFVSFDTPRAQAPGPVKWSVCSGMQFGCLRKCWRHRHQVAASFCSQGNRLGILFCWSQQLGGCRVETNGGSVLFEANSWEVDVKLALRMQALPSSNGFFGTCLELSCPVWMLRSLEFLWCKPQDIWLCLDTPNIHRKWKVFGALLLYIGKCRINH